MRGVRRGLARVQAERVRDMRKVDPHVDLDAIRRVDERAREEILADERTRTGLARERAVQSKLRWESAVRWAVLAGLVLTLLVALAVLVVSWLRGETEPAIAAASAVVVQLGLLGATAIRQGLFGAQDEPSDDDDADDDEEPSDPQLRLLG